MQVQKCIKIHFIAFRVINGGDLIKFVELLYNLSFKEAIQKLNEDFSLGLESNTKIDYKKIQEMEKQRKQKELEKKRNQDKFNELCNKKIKYLKIIQNLNNKININNWENITLLISKIQTKCDLLELEIDELDNILSSR